MERIAWQGDWDEISSKAAVALESVPQEDAVEMLHMLVLLISKKRKGLREENRQYSFTFKGLLPTKVKGVEKEVKV